MVFSVVAAFSPLEILAELINIGTLMVFNIISVAILVLRKTRPNLPRAFRCPGVPIVPIAAIVLCTRLMAFLKLMTWMAFGVWIAIGLVVYFGYARKRSVLGQRLDIASSQEISNSR